MEDRRWAGVTEQHWPRRMGKAIRGPGLSLPVHLGVQGLPGPCWASWKREVDTYLGGPGIFSRPQIPGYQHASPEGQLQASPSHHSSQHSGSAIALERSRGQCWGQEKMGPKRKALETWSGEERYQDQTGDPL